MKTVLVTGGCGFIGSHFIRQILPNPDYRVLNLDLLTYAGNKNNLKDVEDNPRYVLFEGDICDSEIVDELVGLSDIVVNFAAESHVDRSIKSAEAFIKTNVLGTYQLLEAAKRHGIEKFIQISTDEVYGSVKSGFFYENSLLNPSSPYSASKATADLLSLSYYKTYGLPVIITRSCNNFGENQYPEKLIPLFIKNALKNKSLPLYGNGKNVREWIYVKENCQAIELVMNKGKAGEIYNIGSGMEMSNIELVKTILKIMKKPLSLIKYVEDRKGHDFRYSLDSSKIKELGFHSDLSIIDTLEHTIAWYRGKH